MQDRPEANELLQAVGQHLQEEVLPALEEPRLRFRTLVAVNVLAIVARQQQLGPEQAPAEWGRLAKLLSHDGPPPAGFREQGEAILALNEQLCQAIEAGAFDEPEPWSALLAHCRQTAREKLAIANPKFLRRFEEQGRIA